MKAIRRFLLLVVAAGALVVGIGTPAAHADPISPGESGQEGLVAEVEPNFVFGQEVPVVGGQNTAALCII